MRRLLPVTLCALLFSGGCASLGTSPSESHLAEAVRQLDAGKEEKARVALQKAASEKVPADSDEALFRLALLQLRSETEESSAALQTLERLKREHPRSRWTAQSAPLLEFLIKTRRQARTGASLARENRELRQTIEKLKKLDLQLEQKQRR
jgi:hypothetical protein